MNRSVLRNVFLAVAAVTLVGSISSAAKKEKNLTIANEGDFVILSDFNKPSVIVFLSYSGRPTGKCGIVLKSATHWKTTADDMAKVLVVNEFETAKDIAKIKDGRLTAIMSDPEAFLYGTIFEISTRSGKPIKQMLDLLNPYERAEVIVEALPCDKVPVVPAK